MPVQYLNVHVVERQVLGEALAKVGGIENSITSILLDPFHRSPTSATTTSPVISLTLPLLSPTSVISTTTSTTSTSTPTSTPTPTSTSTTSLSASLSPSAEVLTSGGVTSTATTAVLASSSPPTSSVAAASPPKSFLQNKPLEGAVFALAGIVVLVLLVIISTLALRRRHRLHVDAISFDPSFTTDVHGGAGGESFEKNGMGVSHLAALGSESSLIRHANYIQIPPSTVSPDAGRTSHAFYGQSQNQGHSQQYATYNTAGNPQYSSYRPPPSWQTDPYLNRVPAQVQTAGWAQGSVDNPESSLHLREPASPMQQARLPDTQFGARILKIANA